MPNEIYESGMTPVNKMAGRVISKGFEHQPKLNPCPQLEEQKTPFPVRELREIPVNIRHLIGYRFGRMTVMGYSYHPKRWCVRCACGTYCLRATKAICNQNNTNDACRICRAQLFALRRDYRLRTGKDITIDELPQSAAPRAPLPKPVIGGPKYVSHNPNRSGPPKPAKSVPLHWSEQQRAVPTTMASALTEALKGKHRLP